MCLQGTIFRTMNYLEEKGPWNHSILLTFWGPGELDAWLSRALETGLFHRLEREVSLWGREGGWAGPASWVCDPFRLSGPHAVKFSVTILKFLSFEQGTPHFHQALQIMYLVLHTGFGVRQAWVQVLEFSNYWLCLSFLIRKNGKFNIVFSN